MMKFFRTENCPGCQDIENILKQLSLACEVIIVKEKNDIPASLPSDIKLPFLIDEGRLIQGINDIVSHLNELEEFKSQWYKFQSDACYCDDAGNIE
jgi:arsenate reductase-like glutaredoxin family protein